MAGSLAGSVDAGRIAQGCARDWGAGTCRLDQLQLEGAALVSTAFEDKSQPAVLAAAPYWVLALWQFLPQPVVIIVCFSKYGSPNLQYIQLNYMSACGGLLPGYRQQPSC